MKIFFDFLNSARKTSNARVRSRVKTRPSTPARVSTKKTMAIGMEQISYTFTVSRLARRITIKVSPEKGVEVIVPYRYSAARLDQFLYEKQQWILRHWHKAKHHKKTSFQLVDGATLEILGTLKTIRLRSSTKKKDYVKEVEPLIFTKNGATPGPSEIHIFTSENPQQAKKALEQHFRKIAEKYLPIRTQQLSLLMGTHYGIITIRSQKTRWGSCSSRNNLNFNWRLILMPPEVCDYVIFHELTHTVHHDHSSRFYALLQKFCPEYKNLRKILSQKKDIF